MVRAKVVTVTRWYAQDEVNQEESEHNEVDGTKEGSSWVHRKSDAYAYLKRAVGDLYNWRQYEFKRLMLEYHCA